MIQVESNQTKKEEGALMSAPSRAPHISMVPSMNIESCAQQYIDLSSLVQLLAICCNAILKGILLLNGVDSDCIPNR
jgi:hypothetical protein